jgi:hypothetical protein
MNKDIEGITKLRNWFRENPGPVSERKIEIMFGWIKSDTKLASVMSASQAWGILYAQGDDHTISLVKDIPDLDFEILCRGGSELTDGMILSTHVIRDDTKIQTRTIRTIERMQKVVSTVNGITRSELSQVFKISPDRIRVILELAAKLGKPFYAYKGLIMSHSQYYEKVQARTPKKKQDFHRVPGTPLIRYVTTNGIGGSYMISNVSKYLD